MPDPVFGVMEMGNLIARDVGEKLALARQIANDKISLMEPLVVVMVTILAGITISTFLKALDSAYRVISDQGMPI
jgi:hypothetical protein